MDEGKLVLIIGVIVIIAVQIIGRMDNPLVLIIRLFGNFLIGLCKITFSIMNHFLPIFGIVVMFWDDANNV